MPQDDSHTGADLLADALAQYGVRHVFGNPGTTELPVVMAVGDHDDLNYRLALHEDIAVGMAAGYARNRRYQWHRDDSINPVGVVNLHITPGVAHGLGNLYAANIAGAPLVVTAGNNSLDHRQEEPALSGELIEMVDQFTKWSAEVLDVTTLPTMIRRAFRTALTPPTGPVFLSLPLDVMGESVELSPDRLGPIPEAGRGDQAQIENAAEILIDNSDCVLVVGDGIARTGRRAIEATVELAEAAGAEVYAEMLASEVNFPSSHPQFKSFLPLDASTAKAALDADTVVFIGCSTNTPLTSYDGSLVPAETRCIHIADDPHEIGKHQPVDAAVIGDPGQISKAVAEIVAEGVSQTERERRLERITAHEDSPTNQSETKEGARPTKIDIADTLQEVAPDAYLVDEAITSSWALKLHSNWEFKPEHYQLNKGAGLGYGLPAAVGAAMAEAERDNPRTVIGYVGDGSFLYYPQSLYTAARYDLDLTIVIPNNRSYEVLKSNVVGLYGGSQDDYPLEMMDITPNFDFSANAQSQGVTGERVNTKGDLKTALRNAIDKTGPSLVDVHIGNT